MRRLFIIRKDLHMSVGKLIAQTCHCTEAYWTRDIKSSACMSENKEHYTSTLQIPSEIFEQYICGTFTKIVCEAKNKNHINKAIVIAREMGLVESKDYGLIYDNCLTELDPEEADGTTLTGLWFRPLPDNQAYMISKGYQLYK